MSLILLCLTGFISVCEAQRIYKPNSVLASGNWYKIAVKKTGIYKIDLAFLNSMGISGSVSSNSIRLYGNGGQMLAEANNIPRMDDLEENSIMIADGGDGVLNGSDYILFYANGPDQWLKDSANLRFSHQKNIYSDGSIYFLSIGGTGKRISTVNNSSLIPNISVTSFNDRYFHELDTVNLLGSGKDWLGEEFADAPGKTLSRNFLVTVPGATAGSATLVTNCQARSVGGSSNFSIQVNNTPVLQLSIPSITGGQYDLYSRAAQALASFIPSSGNITVTYSFSPGSFNAQGWLDWFEIFTRSNLSMSSVDQLPFRDWQSVGTNNTAEFVISAATASTQVWDVTDPLQPVQIQGSFQNGEFRFRNTSNRLREYIAFNNSNFLTPEAIGKITDQDLHNSSPADLIIITYPPFLQQAQRLAQFHQQHDTLRTVVATTDQVFNEFASGQPDPTAIRDFAKMYYDKAGGNSANQPKYLLLFGAASFDYKSRVNNNTNFVPGYETRISSDPLSTYTSDDFFGFLDDNEDINSGLVSNLLDVGIGRISARTIDDAKNYVDKVISYYSKESFGPWRNTSTFIADDEDQDLHLQDAESIVATTTTADSILNISKIYLDAYQQVSGSGGSTYPQANEAINNQVYNGTLIWNYNGHGGSSRLAEETILDQGIVNTWNNATKLPLFITATCDFAPYDNPTIHSLGENILLRPKTGGIALLTTTRVVFAYSNRIINNNYLQFSLQRKQDGSYKTLGEALRQAKNYTYQNSGDVSNNRKFTLLGDPALTLGFPKMNIRVTKINGTSITQPTDTLKATARVTIEGDIADLSGNTITNFNGTVYPVLFDKVQTVSTLGNDATSPVTNFQTQNSVLFNGKSTVTNGHFSFSFKVPKDINYQYGKGRLSLYAENGIEDAAGLFTGITVGGIADNYGGDNEGPVIKAWLNDEKFVNGSISNESPVLILKLSDTSGINTTGSGIGHDLVATLDNDNRQYFVLNNFYQGDTDSYQSGSVRFQMPALEPGHHQLKIKAWDVLNNSSEYILEFIVVKDEELRIDHVLNYPNPFTTSTQFWFEHNKPGQDLQVRVEIFTITGRLIKTLQKTINDPGDRSCDLEWNGKDEFGDKLARGVYLYRLSVTTTDRKKKTVMEKLVIF